MQNNNYELADLDLKIIKDFLQDTCLTFQAKKEIENMKVLDFEQISYRQSLSKEFLDFFDNQDTFFFSAFDTDLSFTFTALEKNIPTLPKQEILEIYKLLSLYKDLEKSCFKVKDNYPLIYDIFFNIDFPDELLSHLSHVMDLEGNILDGASGHLQEIRSKKYKKHQNIDEEIHTIISENHLQNKLENNLPVIHNGRYTLSIQSSYKNTLNGMVHGYSNTKKSAYVEPFSLVKLNNSLTELDHELEEEIKHILSKITLGIIENLDSLQVVDNYLGKLEYMYRYNEIAHKYHFSIPSVVNRSCIQLFDAFHPVLLLASTIKTIPINVKFENDVEGLIISGPNAGGKTVTMKTIGLLTYLALLGFPIPASSASVIGYFTKILVELGDGQDIDKNLSTFSAHLTHLSRILEKVDETSLVLIDEIASQTDPKEGEAFAYAFIHYLIEKKCYFLVTSHYHHLNDFTKKYKQVKSATMLFDQQNHKPTYQLVIGKAGRSFALETAKNLGFSKVFLDIANNFMKERLSEEEKELLELKKLKVDLIHKEKTIEEEKEDLHHQIASFQSEKEIWQDESRSKEKKKVLELQNYLQEVTKKLNVYEKQMKQKKLDISQMNIDMLDIKKNVAQIDHSLVKEERKHPVSLKAHDKVYVATFKKIGEVMEISGKKVKVQLGKISTTVQERDIFELFDREIKKNQTHKNYHVGASIKETYMKTLDVRGEYLEDALSILDRAIDQAVVENARGLSIIHGHGTGSLKIGIWKFLKDHPNVKEFNFASEKDGGKGKTIVIF